MAADAPTPRYVVASSPDRPSLRRVEPYAFTYTMHCKGRWQGREPLEVFAAEFKMNPPAYYEEALADGRITVNDRSVEPGQILKNGDVIRHRAHRHEPPVPGARIGVVGLSPKVLAVDKPPGLPMHPCGSYHFNTLTSLLREDFAPRSFRVDADGAARGRRREIVLAATTLDRRGSSKTGRRGAAAATRLVRERRGRGSSEREGAAARPREGPPRLDRRGTIPPAQAWAEAAAAAAAGLRQVHRLDRLTSGLVLFARDAAAARDLCECIGGGGAQKTCLGRAENVGPGFAMSFERTMPAV